MATDSSSTSERKPATTRKTTTAARKPTAPKPTAPNTTSTQPKTRVEQVHELAERAVLVPVGASLIARDDIVSTVKGLATKYRTRSGVERELKRFERRGVTARNRFERQVRKTRTRFEREVRQRRTGVERTVKQNRRRFGREVRSVRKDLEKQSELLTSRVEKLVTDAQELLTSVS
jgi:hypothetical protein